MKVLFISSSFYGVNQFSIDLLDRFRNSNIDAHILTDFDNSEHPHILNVISNRNLLFDHYLFGFKRFIKKINNINNANPKYSYYDFYATINRFTSKQLIRRIPHHPDKIVLLSNDNFVNYKNIYELSSHYNRPVFILMMDMAPITGGCHYAWDCDGYIKGCGTCPGLNSNNKNDFSSFFFNYKQKYINNTNIILITASEWQYLQGLRSLLYREKKIAKILSSFDENIFCKIPKNSIRHKYSIPLKKKVIFFGAYYFNEERKGMQYLVKALSILKNQYKINDIHLLIAGDGIEEILKKEELSFQYTLMGVLPYKEMHVPYQISDVFLCPSIEDSGPTMINQSILCGTPVVSFNMGVALDLVINYKTGYRAKLKDALDMAFGLYWLLSLSDFEYSKISSNCMRLGREKCSHKVNIESWTNILKDHN